MASQGTITGLSTVFTQPASCSTLYTFEAESFNSVPGGLLIQNALPSLLDTACFPSGFTGNGKDGNGQTFSPGLCFAGYTTINLLFQPGPGETAVCCPLGFGFTSSDSFTSIADILTDSGFTFTNFEQTTSAVIAGCSSVYTGATTVPAVVGDTTTSKLVTGPITMVAQPITIVFNQDEDHIQQETSITSSSEQEVTSENTAVTTIFLSIPPSKSSFATMTTAMISSNKIIEAIPATSSSLSTIHHSSSPSTRVIVGVSIAGGIVVLTMLVFLIIKFRKCKKTKSDAMAINPDMGSRDEAIWQRAELPAGPTKFTWLKAELGTGREAAELDGDPVPVPFELSAD